MIENKDIAEALDRIARTPDGQLLYRFLQKTLCGVMAPGHRHGALRQHEGRRSFAAELMAIMAEGIADSDRHAITFARTGGTADSQSRTRGAGRRVTDDTFVPGWDAPASSGGGASGSGGSGPADGNAA